jgi:hypothetical protein
MPKKNQKNQKMRKTPVVEGTVTPFTFPDWMKMSPGSLIMGLALYRHATMLAESWYVSDPNKLKIVERLGYFPVNAILEKTVRWRENLSPEKKMVNQTAVYMRSFEEHLQDVSKKDSCKLYNMKYQLPVGIFLGHVIRVEGITLVNVLTADGIDCWI